MSNEQVATNGQDRRGILAMRGGWGLIPENAGRTHFSQAEVTLPHGAVQKPATGTRGSRWVGPLG